MASRESEMWPGALGDVRQARDLDLTTMDYSKHQTPEADAILQAGIKVTINEAMTDDCIARWRKRLEKSRATTRCKKSGLSRSR
jgi:hypothetical protein